MKHLIFIAFIFSSFSVALTAQEYEFGDVSVAELSQTEHPVYKDADAAILYRGTETKFVYNQDAGFEVVTEYVERIKIYNQDGYDYANHSVGLYQGAKEEEKFTSLKAYTYNLVDGKVEDTKLKNDGIFEEKRSKTMEIVRFTMPNIQDGCIVEYRYTKTSPFISQIDEFQFQEEIPIDKVSMRFFAPEYLIYRTHGKGGIPLNIINEQRSRTLRWRYESNDLGRAVGGERGNAEKELMENGYIIQLSAIPPMVEEAYAGNIDNYKSALQFELAFTRFPDSPMRNLASTWEDVATAIYKSRNFGEELQETRYFKKDLEKLLTGLTSQEEKMKAIFEFVQKRMTWNEYYGVYTDVGVKKAYNDGQGNVADINLMLTAMLREAGIEVSPVLISTKNNGIPFFPTRSGFNYVVAGAKINDKVILLDATNKEHAMGLLRINLINWQGRMVKENGTSRLIDLMPESPSVHNSMITATFDDDLVLEGESKNRYSGYYAVGKRNQLKESEALAYDEVLNKQQSKYIAADVIVKELDNLDKPVGLTYSFETENGIEEIGDKIYLSPLMFLSQEENVFKSETRSYPVDFSYPWADKYILTLKIPDGYEVESLPEGLAVNLAEGMGSFRYVLKQNGNTIRISLSNSINTPVINANYYPDLKKYFEMIVAKQQEKVVLKKV